MRPGEVARLPAYIGYQKGCTGGGDPADYALLTHLQAQRCDTQVLPTGRRGRLDRQFVVFDQGNRHHLVVEAPLDGPNDLMQHLIDIQDRSDVAPHFIDDAELFGPPVLCVEMADIFDSDGRALSQRGEESLLALAESRGVG